MNIELRIKRSDEYVRSKRIDCGENVQETIRVETPIDSLSRETRKTLLDIGNGRYINVLRMPEVPKPVNTYDWSELTLNIDSCEPTTEELEAAINVAVAERREKIEQKQAELEREQTEKEAKETKLAEARELLKDEFAELRKRLDNIREIQKDRATLGDFLASIPVEQLEDALVDDDQKQRVEDASPVWIFSNRD